MQPEENQVDPDRGSPAAGVPDNASVPLPILLRVPWFPPETPAPSVTASEDAVPPLEVPEVPLISPAVPAAAWREPEPRRRRWPVLAALAGCLSAIAIGAVVDELWSSRPAVRPQVRRAAARSQTPAPVAAPASEIEPLLAIPSAPRPEPTPAEAAPVRVSLAPDIIPIESGEEP
jgi:hypothetical protein